MKELETYLHKVDTHDRAYIRKTATAIAGRIREWADEIDYEVRMAEKNGTEFQLSATLNQLTRNTTSNLRFDILDQITGELAQVVMNEYKKEG